MNIKSYTSTVEAIIAAVHYILPIVRKIAMFWRRIKNYIPPNLGEIYLFWRNMAAGVT
jgi:hypothetical protein